MSAFFLTSCQLPPSALSASLQVEAKRERAAQLHGELQAATTANDAAQAAQRRLEADCHDAKQAAAAAAARGSEAARELAAAQATIARLQLARVVEPGAGAPPVEVRPGL